MKTDNTISKHTQTVSHHRFAKVAAVSAALILSSMATTGVANAANEDKRSVASVKDAQDPITASAAAVLHYEQPKVTAVDTTPQKPMSINVQSSLSMVKRPMPGTLNSPMESLHLTSPFGERVSPITGHAGEDHLGQDFAASCGTAVYAADSGKVVFSGWHEYGGGNRVEVNHGNGVTTSYNHMEATSVHVGDIVDVGAVVGRVGTTGASTGCHLHFETINDSGKRVDPMGWKIIPISVK